MSEQREEANPEVALEGLEIDRFRPDQKRILWRALLMIVVVVAAAITIPSIAYRMKLDQVVGETEERLAILASGRAEVFETWLTALSDRTDRLVESELFRLFATEVDHAGGSLAAITLPHDLEVDENEQSELGVPLVEQLPFIERVLSDFAISADFQSGYLYGRNGDPYVATAGAGPSNEMQKQLALKAFGEGMIVYGPVVPSAAGLIMEIAVPVIAAQTELDQGDVVSVLVVAAPVGGKIAEILTPPPLSSEGESISLLQWSDGKLTQVDPGRSPATSAASIAGFDPDGVSIAFAGRKGVRSGGNVFSLGQKVEGPNWWVLQEQTSDGAQAALSGYTSAAIAIAVLVVAGVIAAFGAFWWRVSNEHNISRAEQYRKLAARIAAQKRLIDSINDTVAEQIGLKSKTGTYRYVNPAFARAVGRDVEGVIGLDDAALFGAGTAERLQVTDDQVAKKGELVTSSEEIYLGKKLRYLQIAKVPYQGESNDDDGIVSVMRDVTELVEEQRKREYAMQQMVGALVRAIELRDPYLAGHSRRVASFSVEVAKRLGASAEEVMTVEIAAQLSQIGKLKVPRALLNKPERLEPEEISEIQRHLDYALDVLKDIDFDLPVLQTIYAMHERLDGSGYPKGVSGDEINLGSRILAACDVFCARVEPRSYRAVLPADKALEILSENEERYDKEVVAALAKVVESVAGEKLLAGIQAA